MRGAAPVLRPEFPPPMDSGPPCRGDFAISLGQKAVKNSGIDSAWFSRPWGLDCVPHKREGDWRRSVLLKISVYACGAARRPMSPDRAVQEVEAVKRFVAAVHWMPHWKFVRCCRLIQAQLPYCRRSFAILPG